MAEIFFQKYLRYNQWEVGMSFGLWDLWVEVRVQVRQNLCLGFGVLELVFSGSCCLDFSFFIYGCLDVGLGGIRIVWVSFSYLCF